MYQTRSYFEINILKEILGQYIWPSNYTLQETNSGDIVIRFPKCNLIVSEGFESTITAYFPNSETNRSNEQSVLDIFDAIDVVKLARELEDDFIQPIGLVKYVDVEPSLKKVKQGLNNICILLQTYLLPCLQGDYSWVDEYNKKYPDINL